MICWKGECKYSDTKGECTIDNQPCNFESKPMLGTGCNEQHCRHEFDKGLRGANPDVVFVNGLPEDDYLLPFWSCRNICRWYDTCERT